MKRGPQYLRFGGMGILGAAGMAYFEASLFNLSALLFTVSTLIFLTLLLIPNVPYAHHLARRRI